jgi:CRISPR-associated protein Csb1
MINKKFDYKILIEEPRLLMDVKLKPTQGDRFQPTGFPEIGAAEFQRPDGTRMVLVESAQSMANRLESTIIGADGYNVIESLKGISYIVSELSADGELKFTSSLIEAHRMNSPYIISDKNFREELKKEASYFKGQPMNWKKVAKAVFKYDVNSLIHGVFMANLEDGRLKLPRILSSFIEAENIREVSTGGVKNNPIDPTGKLRTNEITKDVYGNVPYHRTEFTAESINAYFNIDTSLLKSYELGENETKLVFFLCMLKIRKFLDSSLRLRTACDLMVDSNIVINIEKDEYVEFPEEKEIMEILSDLIKKCEHSFSTPPVTKLQVKAKWKKEGEKPNNSEENIDKENEDDTLEDE